MQVPVFVAPFVLIADLCIIAAVLTALRAALQRTAWPPSERAAFMRNAFAGLMAWFVLALALSWLEAFRGSTERWPTIPYGIFGPIIVGLYLLWQSKRVGQVLDAIPQSWLVGVQLYRALGVIFILLLGAGLLPPQFALPAGWGDIGVGLLAPIVVWMTLRRPGAGSAAILAWNAFGLLDLAVAVATGVLTSPSPLQTLSLDAPNELISAFPLVMVPVFAVPLSVLLHVASLTKLARDSRAHAQLAHASN